MAAGRRYVDIVPILIDQDFERVTGLSKNKRDAAAYWRANLGLMAKLLTVWFVTSYGLGILFVELAYDRRKRIQSWSIKIGTMST